ncbi:MAG TPA: hypothetical protein VNZ45_15530 [Bacteroidia bacterium]|jgi:hypothetical protein|nr:hypothetical protein [Bacteroidia bacterium]
MRRLLLLILTSFQFLALKAQNKDSSHVNIIIFQQNKPDTSHSQKGYYHGEGNYIEGDYFLLNTDLAQYPLAQPNLGIEYRHNKFAWGINFGVIYPDPLFNVNPLANGQYIWPGTVYYGDAIRVYWKIFTNPNKPANYFSLQAEYAYVWYNGASFLDLPNNMLTVNYTMNETANIAGFDIIHGHEFESFKVMGLDVFYGVGLHFKVRNYSVVSENVTTSCSSIPAYVTPDVGSYKSVLTIPEIIFGVRFGFNFLHRTT